MVEATYTLSFDVNIANLAMGKAKQLLFFTIFLAFIMLLYNFADINIIFSNYKVIHYPCPSYRMANSTVDNNGFLESPARSFEIYVRLTSAKNFIEQIEMWPIKGMKLFFLKKFLELLVVLDDEKKEDHVYGDKFPEMHPEINVRVCYMTSLSNDYYHGWGKARMYLDMMHADVCSKKEYVGFIDTDTLFITAVTDDILFEDNKPIITGRIGAPRVPCWIQTAEYILGVKQVMQCMSYFPVVFKVAHIAEMRKYVEKLHNKTFARVFKGAPEAVKVGGWCYCHYSVLCNYMWYHHRDEYSWHLQLVPLGNWDGKGALPSMVGADYFKNQVKYSEKLPIARSSLHARHLMHKGVYQDNVIPPLERTNNLMREGLCYSFGFQLCPKSCLDFNQTILHDGLFAFENYRWQWDNRCCAVQNEHYEIVHYIMQNDPKQFNINLNPTEFCTILDDLRVSS